MFVLWFVTCHQLCTELFIKWVAAKKNIYTVHSWDKSRNWAFMRVFRYRSPSVWLVISIPFINLNRQWCYSARVTARTATSFKRSYTFWILNMATQPSISPVGCCNRTCAFIWSIDVERSAEYLQPRRTRRKSHSVHNSCSCSCVNCTFFEFNCLDFSYLTAGWACSTLFWGKISVFRWLRMGLCRMRYFYCVCMLGII